MAPNEKKAIAKLHEKYYGKGSKAQQENKKVEKAIKGMAVEKVNEKFAKAGLPIRIVTSKPVAQAPVIAPDMKSSPKEGIVMAAGSTRNDLMMQCKNKGVKNYRVLNKKELEDCLAHIGDQSYVDGVVKGAVDRWRAGWGAKARLAGRDHKEA